MIMKAQDARQRVFQGVAFDVLAVGMKSMLTKMRYPNGNLIIKRHDKNYCHKYVTSQ